MNLFVTQLQEKTRQAIAASVEAAKAHALLERFATNGLEPIGASVVYQDTLKDYAVRRINEGIAKSSAEAVLRLFAYERQLDVEILEYDFKVQQAVKEAAKDLDFETLYLKLGEIVDVDDARHQGSAREARRLRYYYENGALKGRYFAFSQWATLRDFGDESCYSYDTVQLASEICRALERFLLDLNRNGVGVIRATDVAIRSLDTSPVNSRRSLLLFHLDEQNYIELVTYKSKIEYRIYGKELIADFAAWIGKYASDASERELA